MKKNKDYGLLKAAAYGYCVQFVEERRMRIQIQINELENALTSETKSSAGDKHETGRAMIQLEREKLGQQLAELEKTEELLSKVPKNPDAQTVGLGNLIITDKSIYYIAISSGEFKYEGQSVYCISAATPIGQLVMGKTIGHAVRFNGNNTLILSIH